MRKAILAIVALASLALATTDASAEAEKSRFSAGGYFRVMTRPDFQGGDSQLGFWNLYGRLLNEGPYAALELKLDMLQAEAGTTGPWTSVHAKIEGGSVANAERRRGRLDAFALTQLYAKAGNVGIRHVTWQLGTLDSYFGDLGLYDMKPAQIFFETVGLSGRYKTEHADVLLGVGDSGFFIRGADYNTIFTLGGSARLRFGKHLELGGGGQYFFEPQVEGNRFAPYYTPDVEYEDFLRQEVVMRFLEDNPGQEDNFTRPLSTESTSYKVIGYLGFGGFGPLRWNNLFANYQRRHPDNFYTETYQGRDYDIYIKELTDERYQMLAGNEMHLRLIPGRLDAVWGLLYGMQWDNDNQIAPSDNDRTYYSTVLRLQYYLNATVHLLGESSIAREVSHQGNMFREHADSIFANTDGVPDARGLEFGDADTRNTWQGKFGVVLNPLGYGIFTRPSLRILYGTQYSNQNNAFGNNFVETLDQFDYFGNKERHWHHVIAVEAEAWF